MTVQCALNLEFFLDYRVEILSMKGFGATPIMVQLGGLVTKWLKVEKFSVHISINGICDEVFKELVTTIGRAYAVGVALNT